MADKGLPNIHFGVAGETRPQDDDADPDVPIPEEELAQILGFDPFEEEEEED